MGLVLNFQNWSVLDSTYVVVFILTYLKVVANAPVPLTVNTNIKVSVVLTQQLTRHTGTLIFT